MPQGPKPSPLMKPFVVLALPGMYLFYKYNQYKRKRKENATRRLAERELLHLNNKIEKLLSKLDETEPELATCQEEECVICINAKATMQTSPCGHQVVCRKCFVKTIQIAVSQRLLPLRCVICRAKILRLKTGPILPTSASGYSMTSRASSVPQSDSLYSVSSGGSSISSTSSSSNGSKGEVPCCGGRCLGAYPRQPVTGAIKRSQQHAMKIRIQDYCRPEKTHVNRLPPIRELPGQSPLHNVPPASTRIRCAQKIVTQLELPLMKKGYKYEKLPQEEEEEEIVVNTKPIEKDRRWWRDRTKSEERIDNKKNEIVEKQMEMKEKKIKGDKTNDKNTNEDKF
ncbi:uncharacterized protein LOC130442809 [Diorhabda sublineata]|uniref:uncharacterized protein LOC130442809 n=1 Tax=Diorhabda sublineata TaxID=1163346 RepID=UPI0024E0A053|nr:uncharacterized protein LOC130442809 [Diorhabda sublineata]